LAIDLSAKHIRSGTALSQGDDDAGEWGSSFAVPEFEELTG